MLNVVNPHFSDATPFQYHRAKLDDIEKTKPQKPLLMQKSHSFFKNFLKNVRFTSISMNLIIPVNSLKLVFSLFREIQWYLILLDPMSLKV